MLERSAGNYRVDATEVTQAQFADFLGCMSIEYAPTWLMRRAVVVASTRLPIQITPSPASPGMPRRTTARGLASGYARSMS